MQLPRLANFYKSLLKDRSPQMVDKLYERKMFITNVGNFEKLIGGNWTKFSLTAVFISLSTDIVST